MEHAHFDFCVISIIYSGSKGTELGDPAGKTDGDALRRRSGRCLMLRLCGSAITSDGELLAYRELDGVVALTSTDGETLADARTGKCGRHRGSEA